MTATIEAPVSLPVVMTTADGESRAARMWGADSYTCAFCDSPVFGPADWQAHEQANADHYAKRGESYDWEPYSYRAKYWEARECANPGCVTALSGGRLERYREDQRRREEREAQNKRWEEEREREKAAQIAAAQAAEDKRKRGIEQAAAGRLSAVQLGFAWSCVKDECEVSGNDRAEFTAHAKSHGLKAPRPVKPIRLRKGAPAASLRKLEIPVAKWLRWDEDHREPGTCGCGHSQTAHRSSYSHTGEDVQPGCGECTCGAERYSIDPVVTTATRRGQFWSEGTRPHTFWVLPFEAAPWESGRPAPVMLARHRITHGWEVSSTGDADVVRRAENVRHRGVFAIRTGEGSLRGYSRASAYVVHTDPGCASADGWRESDHQAYDVWAVVDRLTGRTQGDSDHTLCPRCVMLGQD